MAITQNITAIPKAGKRGIDARDAFVIKQEAFQDALTDTFVTEINAFREQANTLETNVNNKEASATQSATTASTKADEAKVSATTATTKASEASSSASVATTKATEANNSASSALSSKNSADASATTATTKANEASSSASSALSSKNIATTKASEASSSANTSSTKATEASNSAGIATTKATEASNSADLALASENAAKISENNAKTSEINAQQYAEVLNPDNYVKINENQRVDGTITFTKSPIAPTPTTDYEVATKKYVDNKYSGFKNYIINGNFDIWQRGGSQTSSGYGSDDRWVNGSQGSTKTHSRVTCTDTERALFNANYFSRTVVTSVAGDANQCLKYQAIEDITRLAGKTVTLSFWARADSNKNIAIELAQIFGSGGTPSSVITGIGSQLVSLTSTWQKKTVTLQIPSIEGKNLGTDGVHTSDLRIHIWFDAGSNSNSRASSLGQQSGTFDIAQVQLEEGSVATAFENRPSGLELSLCQRYYQCLNITFSETNATIGAISAKTASLPTVMRVSPIIFENLEGGAGVASVNFSATTNTALRVGHTLNSNGWYRQSYYILSAEL